MATATRPKLGVPFRSSVALTDDVKQKLVTHLNRMLADTFDLYSQTKQAHWNVKGSDFIQFHELFDALAGLVLGFVDEIAERATALGGYATGTTRMAAGASSLPEYPTDAVEGLDHVRALAERVAQLANAIRGGIDEAANLGDQNTADLYTQIGRELDKQLWFLEAHLQGEAE